MAALAVLAAAECARLADVDLCAPERDVLQSVRELLQVADSRWQTRGQAGDNVTAVIARITPTQQE